MTLGTGRTKTITFGTTSAISLPPRKGVAGPLLSGAAPRPRADLRPREPTRRPGSDWEQVEADGLRRTSRSNSGPGRRFAHGGFPGACGYTGARTGRVFLSEQHHATG